VHFKNKTSLLEVALYEDIEKAVAEAVASLPAEADLHSRLMHIPKTMFSFYDGNRDLYRALIRNTVFEPEKDNPHISAQLQQYIQFLAGMIEQEKFQDNIRQDVDAVVAAATIASLYMGVLITFYRNPEITPQMALENLAAMQRQHLTGIMTERGKDGLNP
jgi:AcrR family transcriptional regulator